MSLTSRSDHRLRTTVVVRQSGTTAVLVREQSTFTSATGS
jgi:hypothetical protein